MKTLDLKQAIELLRSGAWLDIRYITADVEKGKGGTVKHYPRARVIIHAAGDGNKTVSHNTQDSKAQNHHQNVTVNVELPNRLIRKIQIPLITHINSVPVI